MTKAKMEPRLMIVDCCEHMIAILKTEMAPKLIRVASKKGHPVPEHAEGLDLIVIGVAVYPVRRVFISQLRQAYPNVPLLILRREEIAHGRNGEHIRGEFILSDRPDMDDYDTVRSLRKILPLAPCQHMHKGYSYDTVREAMRIIAKRYTDPELDLEDVAKQLPISPRRLSRILNQHVGVSFRQLLRNTRIEEAKRILASHYYSVKEVAALVGFTNSHYFSRSFKEVTGLRASEYKSHSVI